MTAVLLCLPLLLSACSNSKLIISPLYNRLDDRIRDEFHKLGDFNAEQEAAFEAAVGTFHVWHRQSELPRYAGLINEMAASIAKPEATSAEDVRRWLQQVEAFSMAARQCYPANFMAGPARSLTDEQFDFIERRLRNQRRKNLERYASRTPEERVERRVENLDKWLGRAQLQLTRSQRQLLRDSLEQQVSLRKQYYRLTDRWSRQLFNLARQQGMPNYEQRLQTHLASLWTLLETRYPEPWQANRDLWHTTAFELIQSLDATQRREFSAWLRGLSRTLQEISTYEPSFTVGNDPAVGCLVDDVQESDVQESVAG